MPNCKQPMMHSGNPMKMFDMDKDDMDKDEMEHSQMHMNNKLENMPLAMAYVPWQYFDKVYDLNKALEIGTIFPELDLPFCGMRGKQV